MDFFFSYINHWFSTCIVSPCLAFLFYGINRPLTLADWRLLFSWGWPILSGSKVFCYKLISPKNYVFVLCYLIIIKRWFSMSTAWKWWMAFQWKNTESWQTRRRSNDLMQNSWNRLKESLGRLFSTRMGPGSLILLILVQRTWIVE